MRLKKNILTVGAFFSIFLVINTLGCLDETNNSNEKGLTASENLINAITIAQSRSDNNISLNLIQCSEPVSDGYFKTVSYTFVDQIITNYSTSYIVVKYKSIEEPNVHKYNGPSCPQPIEIHRLKNNIFIDSNKAYKIAINHPKIKDYLQNGKRYDVSNSCGATLAGTNPTLWLIDWEYCDEYDEPGKNAYIHIDAESGEILKVYTEGID